MLVCLVYDINNEAGIQLKRLQFSIQPYFPSHEDCKLTE